MRGFENLIFDENISSYRAANLSKLCFTTLNYHYIDFEHQSAIWKAVQTKYRCFVPSFMSRHSFNGWDFASRKKFRATSKFIKRITIFQVSQTFRNPTASDFLPTIAYYVLRFLLLGKRFEMGFKINISSIICAQTVSGLLWKPLHFCPMQQ